MMKLNLTLALALALGGAMGTAQASSAQVRAADAQYAQDREICNDERNDGQRMKCLRAAKAENTRALAAARGGERDDDRNDRGAQCRDCGKVTAVHSARQKGEANALGVVGGGAVGGLLGNQVGSGSGRAVATVAGAIGGAYAGKAIQERANARTVWTVDVEYDNGQRRSFKFNSQPGLQRGDRVRNAGNSIRRS
ncbi:glycine zipper 2TM domain-containing protein [Massilia atriviolacea]|uniref:Glycine zipper 2TM domain-containing protein n=1 Tax=Massilia atriviolacea TaxID=2495579 RepID=A0A430HET5_9BURK|nr:glycine zipper 2TM domain-containing protein [Massilia atriviolacea]RSZ56074.1 glycine zipper 2TM domain-containing protein [Massilia atriviolacea]